MDYFRLMIQWTPVPSGFQDAPCREGSCEPQLVGSDCGVPSPITCLWNLLAWSGKCCGNMQQSLGANVVVNACQCHRRKTLQVVFSVQATFFSRFQLAANLPVCLASQYQRYSQALFLQIKLRLALPWLWPFSLSGAVTLSPVCFHLFQRFKNFMGPLPDDVN